MRQLLETLYQPLQKYLICKETESPTQEIMSSTRPWFYRNGLVEEYGFQTQSFPKPSLAFFLLCHFAFLM